MTLLVIGLTYFDEQLYKRRTRIEHANAWINSFKALIVRFEKLAVTWMGLQWIAFVILFARKIKVLTASVINFKQVFGSVNGEMNVFSNKNGL